MRALTLGLAVVTLIGCREAPEVRAQEMIVTGEQVYTTRGHVACTDRAKLEVIAILVAMEDTEALGRILSGPPEDCFRVRPGLAVTVASVAENNDQLMEVRPDGMRGTIWVVRQALVRTEAEIPPPPDGVAPDSA